MSSDATAAAVSAAATGVNNAIVNFEGTRRQNKRQIEFWNMQNQYNHPSSQMARLREAGLNPNLIYGSSGSSQTGNADPMKAADYKQSDFENPLKYITSYADVKQRNATVDNLRSQNTVLTQDAALKAAQTAHEITKGGKTQVDLNLARDLYDTSAQAAKEGLRQLEVNNFGKILDNTIKSETLQSQIMDIYYRAQNARATLQGTNLLNELRRLEIKLNQAGIQKSDPIWARALQQDGGEQIKAGLDKAGQTIKGNLKWFWNEAKKSFERRDPKPAGAGGNY